MDNRPNIIFILSDDQGPWAMHCAGTTELLTPNLDRIASEGMRFENFFCVSPVCSPARASLLTGTIPSAHGVHDWIRSGNLDGDKFREQGRENPYAGGYGRETKPEAYLEGLLTYTDLLAEIGYVCGLAGKWHLGDSVRNQHGFSKWYSLGRGGCCYYHPDVTEAGDIRVEHGRYVTELITDRALDWMDELWEDEKPFYLSIHYTAPHSPWGAEHHPAKWIEYYKDCSFESIPDIPDHPNMTTGPVFGTGKRRENLVGYFAAVSAMDEQIGRILRRLEEKEPRRETILIFTSDNGMSMGHHGVWGKGNGTFPMNMYDTAVRVPFLARWAGHIPPGRVTGELVSAYDMFPTLLELAGISWQESGELPGRSFAKLLLSGDGCPEPADEERAVVVCDEYGPVRMVRTGDWKYIHCYPYGPHALYDLRRDPGEERNLYGDPSYSGKVLELRGRLERWFERYALSELDGTRQAVTGAGQDCPVGRRADRVNAFGAVEEI